VGEATAKGNATNTSTYTADETPPPGNSIYYYKLKLFYTDGSYKYSNTITLKQVIISNFNVTINPNPFTSELYLSFSSPKQQTVTIHLFDVQGRRVYQQSAALPYGYSPLTIHGLGGLSSGIYVIVITADAGKIVKKLLK
jgi:hypothetical protein